MATTSGAAAAAAAAAASNQASRSPPSPYSSAQSESDDEREHGDATAADASAQQPSLPSLSGAALLQLRGNNSSSQPAADDDEDTDDDANARRSRERLLATTTTAVAGVAKVPESDSADRGDDRSSFSGDEHELRVVFHGREVFADDLVGLRVAKSFAGLGRFLGQVVRFDEPTALFTVVYADGDAEELSVDHTLQILIQDDIERADPALPPVAATYAPRAESPEQNDAKTTSTPASQQQQQQQQRSQTHSSQSGEASGPRLAIQISEREAQFVAGLFENHALPVLLREGWKVQANASGSEHRYYAPPGNFPGAGRMFISALAVVELIASNDRMLSACFPQNVRAGIQSLFTDASHQHDAGGGGGGNGAARKRVPASQAEEGVYDPKRQRAAGRDSASGPLTSHTRPLSGHHGPLPSSSSSQRRGGVGDHRSYHLDDVTMERDQDAYPAERMPLGGGGDQFGDGGGPSSSPHSSERVGIRSYHQDVGEYRTPGGAGGSVPVSRWPSGSMRASPAPNSSLEAEEYRRQYVDSPGWREREMLSHGGGSYSAGPPQPQYRDGYRRPDDAYYANQRTSRSSARMMPGEVPPGSYRYHDVRNSPNRGSPGADPFYRQGTGRVSGHPSLDSQALARRDAAPVENRMGSERSAHGVSVRDPSSMMPPSREAFKLRSANPRSGAPSPADHQQHLMRATSEQSKWGSPPDRVGYEHSERSYSMHSGDQSHHRRHHHQQQQPQPQQQIPHQQQQRMPSKADGYADSSGSRRASAELVEQRRAGSVGHNLLSPGNQPEGMM